MNEVNARRARLVLGWVTVYTISVCNKPTRSTQPCIPPGSLNRVPASGGFIAGGNVTSAGWQVTLCDLIWHVSSRSGVTALHYELLYPYTVYPYIVCVSLDVTLLYFTLRRPIVKIIKTGSTMSTL